MLAGFALLLALLQFNDLCIQKCVYCCTPSRTCSSVRASCKVTKSNVVSVAERAAVFLHPCHKELCISRQSGAAQSRVMGG